MNNNEMVSVPREHELKIRQTPLADLLSGLKTGEIRDCSDREFAVGDTVLLREIDDARDYTGTVLRRTITHVQKHYGLPDHLCVLSYGQPAPQTHPEPIAWMVGTAFWWTKEEAERDAEATGLPIVGLGPMTGAAPAEQHQCEPVARYSMDQTGCEELNPDGPWVRYEDLRLADPGEVERLRNCLRTEVEAGDSWKREAQELRADLEAMRRKNNEYCDEVISLRSQLDEQKARHLRLAVASAKKREGLKAELYQLREMFIDRGNRLAERDALMQRALPYLSNTPDLVQHGAEDLAEEIRNVSAGRPCYGPNEWGTECGKCSKCKPASAQPSAPVERDEQLDSDLIAIIAALQADLTARDTRIDELESQLKPDLHSRPEERGTPEAEPCSGCGTPGWTGACNKCIPY